MKHSRSIPFLMIVAITAWAGLSSAAPRETWDRWARVISPNIQAEFDPGQAMHAMLHDPGPTTSPNDDVTHVVYWDFVDLADCPTGFGQREYSLRHLTVTADGNGVPVWNEVNANIHDADPAAGIQPLISSASVCQVATINGRAAPGGISLAFYLDGGVQQLGIAYAIQTTVLGTDDGWITNFYHNTMTGIVGVWNPQTELDFEIPRTTLSGYDNIGISLAYEENNSANPGVAISASGGILEQFDGSDQSIAAVYYVFQNDAGLTIDSWQDTDSSTFPNRNAFVGGVSLDMWNDGTGGNHGARIAYSRIQADANTDYLYWDETDRLNTVPPTAYVPTLIDTLGPIDGLSAAQQYGNVQLVLPGGIADLAGIMYEGSTLDPDQNEVWFAQENIFTSGLFLSSARAQVEAVASSVDLRIAGHFWNNDIGDWQGLVTSGGENYGFGGTYDALGTPPPFTALYTQDPTSNSAPWIQVELANTNVKTTHHHNAAVLDPDTCRPVSVSWDGPTDDFQWASGSNLFVKVVDVNNPNQCIVGATVSVQSTFMQPSQPEFTCNFTEYPVQSLCTYTFSALPPGTYILTVTKDINVDVQVVTIVKGEVTGVTVLLDTIQKEDCGTLPLYGGITLFSSFGNALLPLVLAGMAFGGWVIVRRRRKGDLS